MTISRESEDETEVHCHCVDAGRWRGHQSTLSIGRQLVRVFAVQSGDRRMQIKMELDVCLNKLHFNLHSAVLTTSCEHSNQLVSKKAVFCYHGANKNGGWLVDSWRRPVDT